MMETSLKRVALRGSFAFQATNLGIYYGTFYLLLEIVDFKDSD